MQTHCGLIDPANPCRCRRRIGAAIHRGRVDPDNLLFARRVDALKLDMQHFTDAAQSSAATPAPRTEELVDAVVQAVG